MQSTMLQTLRWSEQPTRIAVSVSAGGAETYLQVTSRVDVERVCLGRPVEELPRITSLLSPAHHLVSAMALDNLFKAAPPEPALHIRDALLHALFAAHHARKLYFLLCSRDNPFREFRLRAAGPRVACHELLTETMSCLGLAQEAAAILGGRPDHPLSAVAGGVGMSLKQVHYERLTDIAQSCRVLAVKMAHDFSEHVLNDGPTHDGLLQMEIRPPHALTLAQESGEVVVRDAHGQDVDRFAPERIFEKVSLHREAWTYEPFAYLAETGWKGFDAEASDSLFFVGPLSRVCGGGAISTPRAEELQGQLTEILAASPGITVEAAFRALLVELVAATERMETIYRQENFVGPSFRTVPSVERGNVGIAVLESPGGFIAHRYHVDDRAIVQKIEVLDAAAENNALCCLVARKAVEEAMARNLRPAQTRSMIETSLLPFR
ncbi:MAG: hypothetical protein AB1646_09375 [Thermodesulfobacteriota bacterium]